MNRDVRMVYCDSDGNLYDHPYYRMAVFDGREFRPPREDELEPLPPGSDVWTLPGRYPVGINPETGGAETIGGFDAAAGFASPAYLRLTLPAVELSEYAKTLPLFAYAPLGWWKGRLYTTVAKVDRSHRQDPRRFDLDEIGRRAIEHRRRFPANRLVEHIEHCAMVYGCRAAQNFFLEREEAPLPTSPTCNAACVGCLSLSPDGDIPAPHNRITFIPSPDEIAEVALTHIRRVPRSVVSFGQGCEGEPLMVADTIEESIRLIRAGTKAGTINLNTNGSLPHAVAKLCEAGLDAIRLSINSFNEKTYNAYYRPRNYALADVVRSGKIVRDSGGFVSINLLVFPGVSDDPADLDATIDGLKATGADFVQLRNLNIDPDMYLRTVSGLVTGKPVGMMNVIQRINAELPHIKFGYFNPPVRTLVLRRRGHDRSES